MNLNAGTLNSRVTIQRRTGGVNDWGEPLPAGWEEVVKVWANVRHLSGSESIKSDRPTSEVRASIRIRFRTGVDAGMRALVGGVTYEIQAVMPDLQRREYTDLVCVQVS